MRFLNLAVSILQQHRIAPMQYPWPAVHQRGRILAQSRASAAGLDTDDVDAAIAEKGVKQADRIGTAADAGEERIGQRTGALEDLRTCLASDDRLQLANDVRIGMAADRRTQQIISAGRIGYPVAQRLVDRRTQCAVAARDRDYGGPEQLHAPDITP